MTESKQVNVFGVLKGLLNTGWLPRITFLGMIILKLTGLLTWSWLVVLSPIWLGIPVMVVMVLGVSLLMGLTYNVWHPIYITFNKLLIEYRKDKEQGKKLAKRQSLTTIQNVLYFVKRTLRFLFVG